MQILDFVIELFGILQLLQIVIGFSAIEGVVIVREPEARHHV